MESSFLQHSRKFAGAFAESQRLAGLVPFNWDRREKILFVIVSVSFVLIERELPISTRINTQLNRFGGFLPGILHHWSQWHDRPGTCKQRHDAQGCMGSRCGAATKRFAGPEIHPTR